MNQQIVIYVFARVVLGLTKLIFMTPAHPTPGTLTALKAGYGDVSKGGGGVLDAVLDRVLVEGKRRDFEWREKVKRRVARDGWAVFASVSWGMVMWLHRWHPDVLQPSLRSSMTYLYDNAEKWSGWRDWVWHNK